MTRRFSLRAAVAVACGLALLSGRADAQSRTATLDIDVDKPGVELPPMFFGLMTEEINHSYDGGLYAELIRNRTFQDNAERPAGWTPVGDAKLTLDRDAPVNAANPVCLKIELSGTNGGAANAGFWGVPVKPGTTYAASFYAKGTGFGGPVTAAIVGDDGTEYAAARSESVGGAWKKYTLTLTTKPDAAPTKAAKFVLSASGQGVLHVNLVSLFPPTYQDHPGGLRADLMELLAGLKPTFIRLPGGNYLEGTNFPNRFDWKKQIGPVDLRPGHQGCWGYRSSDGMGLTQMLLWCRQLNAEPILGVFAGYTLNRDYVPAGPKLQQYVDEALEEIEYVTGGPDTVWGKKRIEDGLVEPFKLQYVEVGNEDWFDRSPSYDGRFAQFYDAIKKKYPHLKVIATMPVKSRTPDLYDDHLYQPANAMAQDWERYSAPKDANAKTKLEYHGGRHHGTFARDNKMQYFIGEWATQEGRPTPTHRAALADAAFVMGLEKSADIVPMQCYAPMFANVNRGAWQWGTNLIGYDAMTAFGSPSYYAQAMLAQNRHDVSLPVTATLPVRDEVAAPPTPKGSVGLGAWDTAAEFKDFSVTGPDGKSVLPENAGKSTDGWSFNNRWTAQDGVLKPAEATASSWGTVGDRNLTDYTVRVKARKTSGAEGFIVVWHAENDDSYHWWNIGGWDNTRTQAEIARNGTRTAYGPAAKFIVTTGKWYDLRLEIQGDTMKGFIDGVLVTEAKDQPAPPPPEPLFASAGYVKSSREVIVKVVNYGREPLETTLNLKGVGKLKPAGRAIVLAGDPRAMNTVEEPKKVSPKEEAVDGVSPTMKRTFPPHSFTLLRLGVAE